MDQSTNFSLLKIATYLIFLRKLYWSGPQQVRRGLIRPSTP